MSEGKAAGKGPKIEFKRDPETGLLIAYEDGKESGPILTMGDLMAKRFCMGDGGGCQPSSGSADGARPENG